MHLAPRTALFTLGVGMAAASAAAQYEAIDLGTLPGESFSIAFTLNESHQVVGNSGPHGFRWTPGRGMENVGSLGGSFTNAWNINDLGIVVGSSETKGGDEHAFIFTDDRGIEDLGTLGGTYSVAESITAKNVIVGGSTNRKGLVKAFRWSDATGMVDLGTLGGPTSYAVDSNTYGTIVGLADTLEEQSHAFIYHEDGGMLDLGTLGGQWSEAWTINDDGTVVGISETDLGAVHGFLWEPDEPNGLTGIMTDLGDFQGMDTAAQFINDHGFIVGSTYDELTALIYDEGWQDLNDLTDLGVFSHLEAACAVDDTSVLTGWGRVGNDTHAFLLVPSPPAPLLLPGLAVVLARRRR